MEKLIIRGNKRLKGSVNVSGAKNSAVALIPATLIMKGIVVLDNVPNISDLREYFIILEQLGAKVEHINKHKIKIDTRYISDYRALSENVKRFRASYYLLGALLARSNKAIVGMPGGCNIGARPIDQHIKGFELLGAEVEVGDDYVFAKSNQITGNVVDFDVVSVGATINVMLSSVRCDGETILNNCAKEPHVVDVANFLNEMGANISGVGTDTIKIIGVKELKEYVEYSVVPDQIEAGTFMIAAVATQGDITVKKCNPEHMQVLIDEIEKMGAEVTVNLDEIRVVMNGRPKNIDIETLPYPGFPTDLQSQLGVSLSIALGEGSITESIWESRFGYTIELNKMGANISLVDKKAIFKGVDKLNGASVTATDLRAGAALIIAGIIADGETEISNLGHIDRGYEDIEEKFRNIGADIERVEKI